MDYRDVLATVVGASVAGIIAFSLRLIFPVNAAVLALVYAAAYSLLWTIVGDHARALFHHRLPASTRLDGHWRLVTGGVALVAAAGAGLIVAYAFSRPAFGEAGSGTLVGSRLVTRTVALQPRVVVTKKTIMLPVETTIVSSPVAATPEHPATVFSRTVVVQRPTITVTVPSTRARTVTETTPTVTVPGATAVVTSTVAPVAPATTTPTTTDPTVTTTVTETAPTP
jgi:hypothetical protein